MKNKKKIIDEIIYYVEEAIAQMDDNGLSKMKDIQVMPVIKDQLVLIKTKEGHQFVIEEHTAKLIFIMHLI